MTVLAKSENQGGLLLIEHTRHVMDAIEPMARAYGFDIDIARKGAILHDLGKGHPAFQAMLIEKPREQREKWLARLPAADAIRRELRYRSDGRNLPHRHEYSSLLFLPLFSKEEWPALIDMVIAHHKSIIQDRRGRGFLDLIEEADGEWQEVFEWHAEAWEEWAPVALNIASQLGLETRPVSTEEAANAFEFVYHYATDKPDGWSRWRGLLMAADHFASGYQHETQRNIAPLFSLPDLAYFEKRAQTPAASLYPLTQVQTTHTSRHTLVVAPTGAGKTDFLIRRCQGRIFYTLPFQASINAMFSRIVEALPGADIRRQHSASRLSLNDETDEDVDLQRHPGASVKVMTPHQLASVVFGTPGHEAMALDLEGNDVILDEVHTYDALARAMIVQMVRTLDHLGCRIHIGTATIPTSLSEVLIGAMGGEEKVYRLSLDDDTLTSFNRHEIHKLDDEEQAYAIIDEAVSRNEHILFVSNQVRRAQERYALVRSRYGDRVHSLLLHSRYKRGDRSALERQIMQVERGNPCVVCATQVIEVSLDLSFDRMITDAAPLDSLIQRFGRVNRIRNTQTIGIHKPIHVLPPPDDEKAFKPYAPAVVRSSFDVLPDGEVLDERTVQALIDLVYPETEVPDAAIHYILDDTHHYRIKELQNRSRSVIIEALDIEGYTAILNSDVERYRNARWNERVEMEIPIPNRFAIQHHTGGELLEMGSYPLIVPDEWYDPDELPLGLVIPSKNRDSAHSFENRSL